MSIKVKVFAVLKDRIGREELSLDFERGISCRDVLRHLENQFEGISPVLWHSLVAVNGQYADGSTLLEANDEMAILPPVSGG